MDYWELGGVVGYPAVWKGARVYGPGGERIGVVDAVLADDRDEIFHGVVVRTVVPLGRQLFFATAEQVAGLYERGLLLTVGSRSLWQASPARPRECVNAIPRLETVPEVMPRRPWDWMADHHLGSR
jgi:hypothetical protein